MEPLKQKKAALLFVLLLNLAGLLHIGYSAIAHQRLGNAIYILSILNYIFVLYYGFFGYKKPHGNLLKYVMILFAMNVAANGLVRVETAGKLCAYSFIWAALTIAFMAGRLHKAKQNAILTVVVLVLITIGTIGRVLSYSTGLTFASLVRNSGLFVQWVGLASAYFVRYAEHKEAGLEDVPVKAK